MRIGELAAAVGVTTRTVRHYHHLGLLPEPERRPNGYREYGLRHAVALARIRRLTELGLGLAEVRDVLADDAGRDLAEVLAELDDDLARQEAAIQERRARLRVLLAEAEAGRLPAEGPVSPELTALFGDLAQDSTVRSESPMAAKDREILALLDTAAGPEDRERLLSALRGSTGEPGVVDRAHQAYALLDELVDADPGDPRVDEAAELLASCLPDSALDGLGIGEVDEDHSFLRAFLDDLAPAQAEAIRRTMRLLVGRHRGGAR
ncbi:MerR family transcriptional regulator [Streptomyces montanus]|uniref:MerR family transcriptional regulator n=1 Tax=Streptomyces montanus TaxID=2580423 RepID=A0A5R9FTF0_9ACTN|nr:MerR family transcriptional regulator [Streptomyces montanus]TLS47312.1 MerR family transcriptional regulator [Streptomyces montanus]